MIELLAPAGDFERLKVAFSYGADAVFIGGPGYGLRANAVNFSMKDIAKAVKYAHNLKKKVYVTVNIVLHNEELDKLEKYLKELDKLKVDAIIVSDPSVLLLAKKKTKLEVHISTQASTLNSKSALFYKKMGASRIVLGRETTKEDIISIKNNVDIEIESFIHGAMCASYSGRCALSNVLTGRCANRGGCAQICRWDFDLKDSDDKLLQGESKFTFSSKDLSMLKYIPEMIEANISSLKIEGRMRSIYYLATVVLVYRKAIDNYYKNKEKYKYSKHDELVLAHVANRESIAQYFNGDYSKETSYYNKNGEVSNQEFLGVVKSYNTKTGIVTIEERNVIKTGMKVTIFGPNHDEVNFEMPLFQNEDKKLTDIANRPKEIIKFNLGYYVEKGDMMRIRF